MQSAGKSLKCAKKLLFFPTQFPLLLANASWLSFANFFSNLSLVFLFFYTTLYSTLVLVQRGRLLSPTKSLPPPCLLRYSFVIPSFLLCFTYLYASYFTKFPSHTLPWTYLYLLFGFVLCPLFVCLCVCVFAFADVAAHFSFEWFDDFKRLRYMKTNRIKAPH